MLIPEKHGRGTGPTKKQILRDEIKKLTEANQKLGERAEQFRAGRDDYRELLTRAVKILNEVTAERDQLKVQCDVAREETARRAVEVCYGVVKIFSDESDEHFGILKCIDYLRTEFGLDKEAK
jgi:hypothetical protein